MAGNSDQNRPSAAKAAADQAKELAKQKAKEQIKKMAAKKGLATALAPVLFWAAVIILIIILLTGIIAFLLTAPGLVTGKLKDYAESLAKNVLSYWGADMTQMDVSEEEQYKVLDYLEQMGYDLKGYGFIDSDVDNKESGDYDAVQGVLRNPETGKISEANSYLIMLYLSSDNYVYTVKNFNPVAPGTDNLLGSFFFYMYKFSETFNIYHRFLSLFQVGILDETSMWGKGLLSIYFEAPYADWHKGDDYSKNIIDKWFGTDTSWTNIKVDPKKKTMSIRRGWGANYFDYELDGWTGRYGMPLEFLLSVQIATLKPDLAYEMATGFNTDVMILLRDISKNSSVVSSYLTEGGKYITYEDVENTIHAFKDNAGGPITDIINWFDDNQITDDELAALQELGFEDSLTKGELKTIIDELDEANAYDFKTYVPYLTRVTDHWYRDVYFVVGADSFDAYDYNSSDPTKKTSTSTTSNWWVTTDLDYEAVTNERWTEYKRYKQGDNIPEGLGVGDYILYVYDDPTGTYSFDQVFPGTQEQANQAGIKVYKKADTGSVFDLIDRGILDEYEDGDDTSIWTAYESSDTGANSQYKRLYPDEDESTYKGKLYYKELLSNNVVQKQDALRRETNPRIKEMFLTRKYFTYDGTGPRAEQIMQVRNQMKNLGGSFKNINNVDVSYSNYLYGAVPDELLDGNGTEFTINDPETGKSETVNIKDMVSTVSLNQDSLAAFAMLENTHTEDADFIYKDFKELIVELGFFTKEDLTEGNPRLMQWPIPEIGSGGYPYRYIDKNVDALGTKIHSKEDIDAAKEYLKEEVYKKISEDYVDPERGGIVDGIVLNGNNNNNTNNTQIVGRISQDNKLLREKSEINYSLVGGVGGSQSCEREPNASYSSDGCIATVTVDGVEYKNYVQYSPVYGDEMFYWSGEYVTISSSACGPTSCVNLLTGYGQDVNPQNTIIGLHFDATISGVGEFMEQHDVPGHVVGSPGEYVSEMESAFADGRPFVVLFDNSPCLGTSDYWTSGGHFVPFVGWGSDGLYTCDPAGPGKFGGDVGRFIFPGTPSDLTGAIKGIWIADIAPDGAKKESNPYVGFEGNEAVVSPVTGILLEYGTYTPEDGDNGYRINTDSVEEQFLNGPEQVGYAKILVLSKEVSNQFVTIGNASGSGLNITPPKEPEELDEWSDDEKALYGYGLFADNYEKAKTATDSTGDEKAATEGTGRYENIPSTTNGIAGYIMYIEGFATELPNADAEEYVDRKESDDKAPEYMELPGGGYRLDMSQFLSHAYTIGSDYDSDNLYSCSLYQKDDVPKLVSETVQKKEEAKADGKDMAVNLLKTSIALDGETKERLLIKEGTVIGRTMSDKELMVKVRGLSNYVSPKDVGDDELPHMYGNYIRMVLKNRKDENVENVEDYLKLDDDSVVQELDDEKFLFWMGVYGEGGNLEDRGGKKYSVPVDLDDGAGATHFYGLTHYNADIAQQLGYNKTDANWGEPTDLQCLTDVYLALHEQQKAQIKQELGSDIPDGYLFAFCSILHNYGNLTKRGDEYKSSHQVSESTWCTYEGTQYHDALEARRIGEWTLIQDALYPPFYEKIYDKDIDWAYNGKEYSEETPFSDFCQDQGVMANVQKSE